MILSEISLSVLLVDAELNIVGLKVELISYTVKSSVRGHNLLTNKIANQKDNKQAWR